MEYEDRQPEVALREELTMLREALERSHRHAGYLKSEIEKRERELEVWRRPPVEDGE